MYKVKRFSKSKKKSSTSDKVPGTGIGLSSVVAINASDRHSKYKDLAKSNTSEFNRYRNELGKASEFIRQEVRNGGDRWRNAFGESIARSDKRALNTLKDAANFHKDAAKAYRDKAKSSGKMAIGAGLTAAGLIGAKYAHDKLSNKGGSKDNKK